MLRRRLPNIVGLSERRAYHEVGHCAAAIAFGIPIIRITIEADFPHLLRGRYQERPDLALEAMVILCLCGPAQSRRAALLSEC